MVAPPSNHLRDQRTLGIGDAGCIVHRHDLRDHHLLVDRLRVRRDLIGRIEPNVLHLHLRAVAHVAALLKHLLDLGERTFCVAAPRSGAAARLRLQPDDASGPAPRHRTAHTARDCARSPSLNRGAARRTRISAPASMSTTSTSQLCLRAVEEAVVVADHREDDRQREVGVVHAALLAALAVHRVDRLAGTQRGDDLALPWNDPEEHVGRSSSWPSWRRPAGRRRGRRTDGTTATTRRR